MPNSPKIERFRHEIKRRHLTVIKVERPTAQMARIVLHSDQLHDFLSLGFDDHIKLFFPSDSGSDVMRDYTPRHFDTRNGELTIDFFLHDAGPATTWAANAKPGDTLAIGGPRGSAVIALEGIDTHVLIGDETAWPAISRRLEELPSGSRALVVFETEPGSQWPEFTSAAELQQLRVTRQPGDAPAQALLAQLQQLGFNERSFFWAGLEYKAGRSLYQYLREERGVDKNWIKAAAYWKRGEAGAGSKIGNDESEH